MLVCNLLCIAGAADGYQIVLNGKPTHLDLFKFSLPDSHGSSNHTNGYNHGSGNVIANQGFINHIGFPNDDGEHYLRAEYTALWGAMQSLGQLVGMVLLTPVSDRIGRKMTLYLLWVLLAGVRPHIMKYQKFTN